MASELPPIVPAATGGHSVPQQNTSIQPEPTPITEEEVGDYREQDRYLPVGLSRWFLLESSRSMRVLYCVPCGLDCEHLAHYEELHSLYIKNLEGCQRMRSRECERVHQFRH